MSAPVEELDEQLDDDEQDEAQERPLPDRWRGVIAPLNTASADGRVIAAPASGKVRVRPLPMPLLYQLMSDDGHKRSVIVGDVDRVWRDGDYLMGAGRFDLGGEHGREAARQLRDGFHRWVSVLIDDETREMACIDADGGFAMGCGEECEHTEYASLATDWRTTSVTMVAEQAFPEATIKPVWHDGDEPLGEVPVEELVAAGISAEQRKKATQDGDAMPGGRYPIRNETDLDNAIRAVGRAGGPEGTAEDRDAVRRHIIKRARALGLSDKIPDSWNSDGTLKSEHALGGPLGDGVEVDDCRPCMPHAILAAGAPGAAPAAWFNDPGLSGPTPLQVSADGRVYGHLAVWDTCHTSYSGRCVTAPRSSTGYAYFHTASVQVDDGDGQPRPLGVGLLTVGTGHADIGDGYANAVAHYDNTGTQAAAVRAGEDEFGIWVAGAVLPGVADEVRDVLARSPLSGDWRAIGGGQELVAALSVNVPGFPIPRYRSDAEGSPYALVAAGVIRPAATPTIGERGGPYARVSFDTASLAKMVVDELERREAEQEQRASAAAFYAARMSDHTGRRRAQQAAAFKTAMIEHEEFTLSAAFNWVEDRGGLPAYIKRIAKHVPGDESQKIATAINAAKKMCSTGDLNWPGLQHVNAGSQAEACAAVAQWEAMKGSK
ncbi:hypothetical protein ACIBG8_54295 [Nonomuraea sp. NPDC050556]|uniref:hypothetical protein n=1 Tax=Nonomuraea sp. NPDC050556 TaxID=3364369 RepID=UPI00378C8C93